jgi:hypothetical protein
MTVAVAEPRRHRRHGGVLVAKVRRQKRIAAESFPDIVGAYYRKYYAIYSFRVLNDYLLDKTPLKTVELTGK